ncbi:hypothetical protein EDC94DRAFT_649271 [Helicostylum pulchrum]|nr:hypothetical protein EDC94DRAFT_649271 [Helicostylum pulchrum]
MLKDTVEQGVSQDYAADCIIYSLNLSSPKLYHMKRIKSFKLPVTTLELHTTIKNITEAIKMCKNLINSSCTNLKNVDSTSDDVNQYLASTYSSPPRCLDCNY